MLKEIKFDLQKAGYILFVFKILEFKLQALISYFSVEIEMPEGIGSIL